MFRFHPTRADRRVLAAGVAVGIFASASTLAASTAFAATDVQTFESASAESAAQSLIGANITLVSAAFTHGRPVQAAIFSGATLDPAIGSGVALSTGALRDADPASSADVDFSSSALAGPNRKLTTTGDLGGPGSDELTTLVGSTTYDAAQLALTVVPAGDTLSIVYQFGSEEYGAWAAKDYTDAVGIYVDGELCSTVDGQPAGISTVNDTVNSASFVSNVDGKQPSAAHDTEMNGFTTALTCTAAVTPGTEATIVAAVADTLDGQLDTTLLLAKAGITSSAPAAPAPGESPGTSPSPVTGAPAGAAASTGGKASGSLARTGGDANTVVGAILAGAALAAAGAGLVLRARRRGAEAVESE
ncbi:MULTISPECIES: choice-of-anchor L domain-containing protein [unclassified Microbacterium]|uniref:choice-of-anchor L domain-containing protein n=1 Tax=unclassified Microbacterium TaxID=2609290 RepID=UPI003015F3A4